MEDLPNYFDVIVVGTGMPECIIAAAAARVGKKVLHIDRNGYYGGDWASFSYDKFLEWMNEVQPSTDQPSETVQDMSTTLASFLQEEENLIVCPTRPRTISNLCFKSYVRDAPEPPVASSTEESSGEVAGSALPLEEEGITSEIPNASENSGNDGEPSEQDDGSNSVTNESSISIEIPSNVQAQVVLPAEPLQQEWTLSSFMENRRKFNIDLAPKIMFSRGSLVELLISSNIARYAEFQCISRVLTHINGHIEQVPCSRADVFSTKSVSVVEKRMLMKFLNFCLKFDEQTDEFKGYEDKPFVEFLRSKKLTSNVEHYVVHAIAMMDEKCPTIQCLQATQKFLQSLGRYGKSPFLCTCYGSAELPQCFCRLCAVYEGMYYLKRKVEGVIIRDNKCRSVVSMGQRIDCEWIVMESSYAAPELFETTSTNITQRISRAILITDASLCPSEKRENTLLRLPPAPGIENPITVLELSSKNYVCPEDLYLVYMSCQSSGPTAEDDLKSAVELLFSSDDTGASKDDRSKQKPNLLWRVFYNQRDTSSVNLNADAPKGLFLTSSPDVDLDYELAVKEACDIFGKICPGEEFLPRAPDPEDILIESHNNPGDDGEGGKIENDVSTPDDKPDNAGEDNDDTESSIEENAKGTSSRAEDEIGQ